ncbi:MAG: hypothetical protein M3125_05430 [Gemmatimonadota bacterium]|nr:hypothetical protein [Gemmatimonadota bacterium]
MKRTSAAVYGCRVLPVADVDVGAGAVAVVPAVALAHADTPRAATRSPTAAGLSGVEVPIIVAECL